VTLSAENIGRLPAIVEYCLGVPDLYGVIFLAYKPKGRGEGYDTPLSSLEPAELYPWLRQAFLRLRAHTRVGYDCCLTPGSAGLDRELGFGERDVLDGCSATRTSVGVSADLDVVPCTFLTHRAIGNLGQQSFMDIWLDGGATAFRKGLDTLGDGREACTTCSLRDDCLGGCPEWDLVRCTRRPLSDQAR
jgi:radical SAM protein with 4Fe4S-binding SPASM domain